MVDRVIVDAGVVTAIASSVLACGVVIAAFQLYDQRRTNRIVQTPELVKSWATEDLAKGRAMLDKTGGLERNRLRVNTVYRRTQNASRASAFGKLRLAARTFVHLTARSAERIEVYMRRGAADEGILVEHLGYGIVMSYYALQDVLQDLARTERRDYEGWRLLALRCQAYAKLHRADTNLFDDLIWIDLPPLQYAGRDASSSPRLSAWVRFRLRFVRRPTSIDR